MLKAIKNTLPLNLSQRTNIKRRSLIFSCLCSGLAYRTYIMASTAGQGQHIRIPPQIPVLPSLSPHCCTTVNAVFLSNGNEWREEGGKDERKDAEARLQTLLFLQNWLENELPNTFSKGLFNSTDSSFFKPETVLEVERSTGSSSIRFRGQSKVNCFLAAVRSYFAAVSCERRIDLLGVYAEPKKWQIEASFRVVLIPSPSPTELNLPPEQLMQRVEQKAKWHDFRVIFYLTKSGSVSLVRITKLTPPHRRPLNITLQRMRVVSTIMPTLRGKKSLPQPLPFLHAQHLSPSDSAKLSESLKELDSLFGVPKTPLEPSRCDVLALLTPHPNRTSNKQSSLSTHISSITQNHSILNASPILLTFFSLFSQSFV